MIARWNGQGGGGGDLTLVWGVPLVAGGVVATAELGGQTLDQCALDSEGRFTLVAIDAVSGFGDDLYLEIKLWNKRGELLAAETLYEEDGRLLANLRRRVTRNVTIVASESVMAEIHGSKLS